MDRNEIARRLETLAKMIRDGDETLIEVDEAREAMRAVDMLEY